ncbi:MAG: hypothetical protein R3C11_21365 [Planctomycetaceae bacterium]
MLSRQERELETTVELAQQREQEHQAQAQAVAELRKQYEADRQKLQAELESLGKTVSDHKTDHQDFKQQYQQLQNWKENLQSGLKSLEKGRLRYWKLLRLDARESVNDVAIAKSLLIHGKITRYQAEWMINGRFPHSPSIIIKCSLYSILGHGLALRGN